MVPLAVKRVMSVRRKRSLRHAVSLTNTIDFGFKDGIANPFVAGYGTQLPGQSLVAPGVLLTGQSGDAVTRASWTQNGSFLAFRQLKQLVPEFNKFLLDNPVSNSSELMGARMMGRWKSVSDRLRL
jgi:deferrochelatase/peroxidase EfeB